MDANLSDVSSAALKYLKENLPLLYEKFADLNKYPPILNPSAYFMAGSPGAGKTEYSKSFIKILCEKEPERKIVRIDPDEIRDIIPYYNRTNANEINSAAFLGVEKLLDFVLKNNQDFLLDGTLASYDTSCKNITRCLNKNRKVGIVYIYQDPLIAWDFTKKREALEGRKIPKDMFIRSFFAAKDNVNNIKARFGKDVEVWLVVKNFEQGVENTFFNIDNVDNHLKVSYTSQALEEQLL